MTLFFKQTHRNKSATRKALLPLYQCDLCEYETNKKSNSDLYRQYHFKKAAYQCNRCSYSLSMPNRLIYHLENHHSDLKQVILFLSLHAYIGRNVYNYLQVGSNLGEILFLVTKANHGNDESSTNTVYNSTHFVFGIIIVKRFINYRRSWRI